MREEVFYTHIYKHGLRVDKRLLDSLESVIRNYDENYSITLSVECENNATYQFESVHECITYFETIPYRIKEIKLLALFGDVFSGKRIEFVFNNGLFENVKVIYRFNNIDDYMLLRNKIERIMDNYKLNYYILSKVPIIPVAATVVFYGIVVYTSVNSIVFKQSTQVLVLLTWLILSLSPFLIEGLSKIKRKIFPCVEFRIGQNEVLEDKSERVRRFIIGSIIVALGISIIGNLISSYLLG